MDKSISTLVAQMQSVFENQNGYLSGGYLSVTNYIRNNVFTNNNPNKCFDASANIDCHNHNCDGANVGTCSNDNCVCPLG